MSRRARRGAAMVEAVCLLPALALLVAGAVHVSRLHAAHRDLAQRARHCALAYARAGCGSEGLPEYCTGTLGGAASADTESQDAFSRAADAEAAGAGASTTLFDKAAKLPLIGDAIEHLFGRGKHVRLDTTVEGTGGEQRSLRVHHHLLCVVPPGTGDDIASQLFDTINPFKR